MEDTMKKEQLNDRANPDIMVDVETVGTGKDAAIYRLSAIRFNLNSWDDVESINSEGRLFDAYLDIADQQSKGLCTSVDALKRWGAKQAKDREVPEAVPENTRHALERLIRFCKGGRSLWGPGNNHDNSALRKLCETYDVEYFVGDWNNLDVRPMMWRPWNFIEVLGSNKKSPQFLVGKKDNLLDKIRRQILKVQYLYRRDNNGINGSKYEQI